MAGTTYSDGVRQQWLGLAKFIFFTELCMPENVQQFNKNMPIGENEVCYDDDEVLLQAWELTKQIFATIEELILMDPQDRMNYIPAFSTSSIDKMLVDAEANTQFVPERVRTVFLDVLSAVAEIYEKPKYYTVANDDIGHNFNKIKPGLGYAVSELNGLCTVLAGEDVQTYNEGKHLEYCLGLFYDAAIDPDFEWEVRDDTLFGREELCFFLQRALVTLLIAIHAAADPQTISWAFRELKDYHRFQIPAVKRDLAHMFRSYHVDADFTSAPLPSVDLGYVSEQPLGMGNAPIVLVT